MSSACSKILSIPLPNNPFSLFCLPTYQHNQCSPHYTVTMTTPLFLDAIVQSQTLLLQLTGLQSVNSLEMVVASTTGHLHSRTISYTKSPARVVA